MKNIYLNCYIKERFQKEKNLDIRIVWSQEFEVGSEAFLKEKEIKSIYKDILGLHKVLANGGDTELADYDFLQLDTRKV